MAEATSDREDPLLARVRQIALSFPGAREKVSHGAPTWFTTKVFASWGAHVKGDHPSPALARAVCLLPDEEERPALLEDPRFHVPGYIGHRGWLAFDLSTGEVDWEEVTELLDSSFRNTAGSRLIRALDTR